MSLLTAGYMPTSYIPESYFNDDYFPDYGTATPIEEPQLPKGKVLVSFLIKVPNADFSIKTATIVFNIK